jgi:cation transport protein ChaC
MTGEGESEAEGHWVFGFGSLMWRPGFAYEQRCSATMHGRHRAFCIYSVHHRGTFERKGLVLGLAAGGSTRGIAYRVAPDAWPEVYQYLRAREQPVETYKEEKPVVRLAEGGQVRALTYLSDRSHPQWAGDMPLADQARVIAGARGLSGRNGDYLRDLVAHLRDEGIRDTRMEDLLALVEELEAEMATEN